jgi:hypothetical protein
MHRIQVHFATQAAALGKLVNVEAMTEIIHIAAVRGPLHLVSRTSQNCRSDAAGSGLLKVSELKGDAIILIEAHSGMHILCYC